MSILREGHMATYIGEGETYGAHAEVLSLETGSAWVRYVTGARAGNIELVDDLDLTPADPRTRYASQGPLPAPLLTPPPAPLMGTTAAVRDVLDDSLDVGLPVRTGAAEVQEAQGTLGVLTMLASRGDLHRLSPVVDEARVHVANRIRQDPNIRQVTGQLDEDDAEDLVQMAALALLHSAFGEQRG